RVHHHPSGGPEGVRPHRPQREGLPRAHRGGEGRLGRREEDRRGERRHLPRRRSFPVQGTGPGQPQQCARGVLPDGHRLRGGCGVGDMEVADGARILPYSHLTASQVGKGAIVGPFARLRPGAQLGEGSHVGNFVEIKKTVLGKGSKANHLSYLGDAVIGEGVNVGAGTITCNYDGKKKHVTTIEDGAFIGSDTQLIAPVTVHKGAYVGTGTTVREDVPAGSLAVSAGKQRNIEGWG